MTTPVINSEKVHEGPEIRLILKSAEEGTEPMIITQQVNGDSVERTLHEAKTVLLDHTSILSG